MIRIIGRRFSPLVAVIFMSALVLSASVLSSLVLSSCGSDFKASYPPGSPSAADAAGDSPTITGLSISPSTAELDSSGGMVVVTVGFTFWDSDMNITTVKLIIDGTEEIDSLDISGETTGTVSLTLLLPTTQTGTQSISVSVLDIRDNESNTLSGTFTVSENGVIVEGNGTAPVIYDLGLNPDSDDVGEGGGIASISVSMKYEDIDSDILSIKITYDTTTIADTLSIFSKSSGSLTYTLTLDTTAAKTYTVNFVLIDSKGNESNTLTTTYTVS